MADSASAPPRGETPRSVSSADMCAIAPFCAIELQKSTMTRIQKTRDPIASRTETPWARWSGPDTGESRSRMKSATVGRPTTRTIPPSAT